MNFKNIPMGYKKNIDIAKLLQNHLIQTAAPLESTSKPLESSSKTRIKSDTSPPPTSTPSSQKRSDHDGTDDQNPYSSFNKIVWHIVMYLNTISSKLCLFAESLKSTTNVTELNSISKSIFSDVQMVQRHLQILENILLIRSSQESVSTYNLSSKRRRLDFLKRRFLIQQNNYKRSAERLLSIEKRQKKGIINSAKETSQLRGKTNVSLAVKAMDNNTVAQNNIILEEYNESMSAERQKLKTKINDKNESINEIQEAISKINEMYSNLAELVELQNDYFERIDENLDLAMESTEKAHMDLRSLLESMRGNKSFFVKAAAGGSVAAFVLYLLFK